MLERKKLKVLETKGKIETIEPTALLRLARIPGDLRRLTVTQTPPKDHHLMLVKRINSIMILVGALGTVPIGFEKGLEELEIKGRIETIQPTALLRLARIPS